MTNREKEIQELCKQIVEMTPDYCYADNYPETQCPFCAAENWREVDMKDLNHEMYCAYLIAKGLRTNYD